MVRSHAKHAYHSAGCDDVCFFPYNSNVHADRWNKSHAPAMGLDNICTNRVMIRAIQWKNAGNINSRYIAREYQSLWP